MDDFNILMTKNDIVDYYNRVDIPTPICILLKGNKKELGLDDE